MGYLYIGITIFFTVYGQLVLKWRVRLRGDFPSGLIEKFLFLLKLFNDPWILSCFFAGFLAALGWMAAMTKFELSHAYPFTSVSFVFVLLLSGFVFHESITLPKLLGVMLIMTGIIVGAK